MGNSALAEQWERANADPGVVEDDDGTVLEVGLNRGKVGDVSAAWACARRSPCRQQDDRWPADARPGEELSEVGVGRDDDEALCGGEGEHGVVAPAAKASDTDVLGRLTSRCERVGEER